MVENITLVAYYWAKPAEIDNLNYCFVAFNIFNVN